MKKEYGSKGQTWHPDFVEYMRFIAEHPTYANMPDAFMEGELIQWEAPSNRQSGKFKDTHSKRGLWWKRKAESIGVDTGQLRWISKTAKAIHPTKEKPCKRCGRVMQLRYVYPTKNLIRKILKLKYSLEIDPLEDIITLLKRLHSDYGNSFVKHLPGLFKPGSGIFYPRSTNFDDWLRWLESEYIPSEPSTLSPGAMSNAPDRFDGFHSFNLCCRGKADKGRGENLKTYTTDRRVFEYWSQGNWIAADRLMGLIRLKYSSVSCANGHAGPCHADHIGPLSLGFMHLPYFQLLCSSCNSTKNNRMSFNDVRKLLELESKGTQVISWFAKRLWERRKNDVVNDETALRRV